jgi:phosphatidylglycerophosphatase A
MAVGDAVTGTGRPAGFRWTNPVHLVACGFGSGLAPYAPGTFGTAVGVLVYLALTPLDLVYYLAAVAALSAAGIWVCGRAAADFGVHDHPAIVWDEVVGYLVTMIAVPPGVLNVLLGFVLFRLFDILKPWPVRVADRRVPGGFGIVLDDLLAGLYAALALQLLHALAAAGGFSLAVR